MFSFPESDCSSLGIGSLGCTNNLFSVVTTGPDINILRKIQMHISGKTTYCSCKFQIIVRTPLKLPTLGLEMTIKNDLCSIAAAVEDTVFPVLGITFNKQ